MGVFQLALGMELEVWAIDLDTGEIQDDEQPGAQKRTRTEKGPRE